MFALMHTPDSVGPWVEVYFDKSDSYRFLIREKYVQCKKKDVNNFFLAVLTSQ